MKTNAAEMELLARLMRAEAEGEGDLGMLMVGNVVVNRVAGNCGEFTNIRSMADLVGRDQATQCRMGFEAICKPYFYQSPREREVRLARRVANGERQHPASYALWFFRPDGPCPAQWWGRPLVGQYKAHCFYQADSETCPLVFSY